MALPRRYLPNGSNPFDDSEGPMGPVRRSPTGNLGQAQAPPLAPEGDDLQWQGAPGQSGETPREREGAKQKGPTTDFGRFGEAPRERPGGGDAAPPQPRTPTPQAGSVGPSPGPAPMPPQPFSPMPQQAPVASLARPMGGSGSLYGGLGGLKGGGLGVPLDPISNQASDPISTLLKLLQGGGKF